MKKIWACVALFFLVLLLINGCGGRKSFHGKRTITTNVVHHTAGMANNNIQQVAKEVSRLHERKFKKMAKSLDLFVAYHYLITPNGKVWKTRDPDEIGHHAGNWMINVRSLAICVVGDFSKHRPTQAQVRSLDKLVRKIQGERNISRVIPHSYCRKTLCCGEYLKREIRKLPWGQYF